MGSVGVNSNLIEIFELVTDQEEDNGFWVLLRTRILLTGDLISLSGLQFKLHLLNCMSALNIVIGNDDLINTSRKVSKVNLAFCLPLSNFLTIEIK